MNTVNNKRRKDSVLKIEKVFLELIQNKDIEEISVSDICKKAGLNRTTFYSNYTDIYDLAEKIRIKMIEDFLTIYSKEKKEMKHSYDFSKLFRHIMENQIFYKAYFKLGFDLLDDDYMIDMSEFVKWYGTDDMASYHVTFFKAGLNAIIKKWLDNGCVESPEEIHNILKAEYKKKNLDINF